MSAENSSAAAALIISSLWLVRPPRQAAGAGEDDGGQGGDGARRGRHRSGQEEVTSKFSPYKGYKDILQMDDFKWSILTKTVKGSL